MPLPEFAAKRCQKSILDCFHTGEKVTIGVSTEVGSSDDNLNYDDLNYDSNYDD